MEWIQCRIFISSTFRDMYYEREYLVKQVLWEFKSWCLERRILMSEIDLRWGVTEWMAKKEHSTILKCLNGVDASRPFFLCFLGQYRGWVPKHKEISDPTFDDYPALDAVIGKRSATEMEIFHAIDGYGKANTPVLRVEALFFRRDPSYLKALPPELRKVYTNEGLENEADRMQADRAVIELADVILPGKGYRPITYTTRLAGQILTDFQTDGQPLDRCILKELKKRILSSFPERAVLPERSEFEKKLDYQAGRLFMSSLEYIDRGDVKALETDWTAEGSPMLVRGGSGSGRSALFSKWIGTYHNDAIYRFCEDGATLNEVLRDICIQLGTHVPDPMPALSDTISKLSGICKNTPIIIALDGLEHFPTLEVTQLLSTGGLKVLGTVRSDCPEGERLSAWAQEHGAKIFDVWPFTSADDRKSLAELYLIRYLKNLDDLQMEMLLGKSGTLNPLFMRIVLSELRMFGSFEGLDAFLEAFGDNVGSAFTAVLKRLEKDYEETAVGRETVAGVFSALTASDGGLSMKEWELASGLSSHSGHLQMILRQIEPFIRVRMYGSEAVYDFGYDAFKSAASSFYSRQLDEMHKKLFEVFRNEADPDESGKYRGDLRSLRNLFHQAKYIGKEAGLVNSLFYLNSRIRQGGLYDLLRDLGDCRAEYADQVRPFLQAAAGSLAHWPDSLLSLMMYEGGRHAEKAREVADKWDLPWFEYSEVELPGLPGLSRLPGLQVYNKRAESDDEGMTPVSDDECAAPEACGSNGGSGIKSVTPPDIITARHFTNVYAADLAPEARLVFRFEKSETVAVYDSDNPENDPDIVRVRKGRVLALYVSSDGGRLAVAYESGVLLVIGMRWDSRKLSWFDEVWSGNYLLPEESDPVFLWDGDSLIFQAEDGSAVRLRFDNECAPAVEKLMELEGEITAMANHAISPAVPMPGSQPSSGYQISYIAARTSRGAVLYGGSRSIRLDYPVSCLCSLECGIAAAMEDRNIILFDSSTLSAVRKIAGNIPAKTMAAQGDTLYIIGRDYSDGRMFVYEKVSGLRKVPGCDGLYPQNRLYHILRAGFDSNARFYSLTDDSFHSVVFKGLVRDSIGSPAAAMAGDSSEYGNPANDGSENKAPTETVNDDQRIKICCVTDSGTGPEAIIRVGSTLCRCSRDGIKEHLDMGKYNFNWLQKDGTAIGFCRINGVGLCCLFEGRTVCAEVPEVMAGGAAGGSIWLLGESGALYRMDENGSLAVKLRPPETGKPAGSVACFGNILVLNRLDTSSACIGPRLAVYEELGGSLEMLNELFFPSDHGHYQLSIVDPKSAKIFAFIATNDNMINLVSGDIKSFDMRSAKPVPLPFVRSIQNAILSGSVIYLHEPDGVIHAVGTNGEHLCSMEPIKTIDALHSCNDKVFAESKGKLYRLEARKQSEIAG